MSIHVASMVWRTRLGGPFIKAVAMKLADHANDDGGDIYPSIERVARETEICARSVQTHLKRLVELGVLIIESEGGKGPRDTRRYRFDLARLEQMHAETCAETRRRRRAKKGGPDAHTKGERRAPSKGASPAPSKGASGAKEGAAPAPEPSLKPSSRTIPPSPPTRAAARGGEGGKAEAAMRARVAPLMQGLAHQLRRQMQGGEP